MALPARPSGSHELHVICLPSMHELLCFCGHCLVQFASNEIVYTIKAVSFSLFILLRESICIRKERVYLYRLRTSSNHMLRVL